MTRVDGDDEFYEVDERPEDVIAAFERGVTGVTGPPGEAPGQPLPSETYLQFTAANLSVPTDADDAVEYAQA